MSWPGWRTVGAIRVVSWRAARCRSRWTCRSAGPHPGTAVHRSTGLRRGTAVRCRSGYVRCYQGGSKPKLKAQDCSCLFSVSSFKTCVPSLVQEPGISYTGFLWVIGETHTDTVGVGNSAPRYRRFKTYTYIKMKMFAWKFSFWLRCLSDNCRHKTLFLFCVVNNALPPRISEVTQFFKFVLGSKILHTIWNSAHSWF